MAEFALTIARSAIKELESLPKTIIERVRQKIRSLAATPRPAGAKMLRGSRNVWRIRVGDYRILYVIDDAERIIDIAGIRHRSKAYE